MISRNLYYFPYQSTYTTDLNPPRYWHCRLLIVRIGEAKLDSYFSAKDGLLWLQSICLEAALINPLNPKTLNKHVHSQILISNRITLCLDNFNCALELRTHWTWPMNHSYSPAGVLHTYRTCAFRAWSSFQGQGN